MHSAQIQRLLLNQNGSLQLQVVNIDIEKYSRRNSKAQLAVIDRLTKLLEKTIAHIQSQNTDACGGMTPVLRSAMVIVPTGDGVILAFSDGTSSSIHLKFAKTLLRLSYLHRLRNPCPLFEAEGWCNCHDNINVRIGISNGETILFRDINHNYNVAGRAVNIAARIKKQVDSNQIALTEKAYNKLMESGCPCSKNDTFLKFEDIKIKHGDLVTVYLYIGSPDDIFINKNVSDKLSKGRRRSPVTAELTGV